nr:YkgJ family cysteine cluster protein [uncultured Sellimonas sp.]
MQRNVDLNEISDGSLYTANDMVRADCNGCQGCSSCCRGMGSSIVLDPYDIRQLTSNLHQTMEELLSYAIELQVVDGLILPNLKMTVSSQSCTFLDGNGRCRIHAFRPGFCRMFPLGRFYEGRSFRYFLQIHECKKENRSKIKVKKWLGIPDLKRYEQFICDWHYLLKDLSEHLSKDSNEAYRKQVSIYLLKTFYLTPYAQDAFFEEFYIRYLECKKLFKLI